jgi:metal-responsive CopG/Arc/MetJ family transcriptional regulator
MSGKDMRRVSMYFHRNLLEMIDECIRRSEGKSELDDWISRSEWIREACRQRLHAGTATKDRMDIERNGRPMAGEGQP